MDDIHHHQCDNQEKTKVKHEPGEVVRGLIVTLIITNTYILNKIISTRQARNHHAIRGKPGSGSNASVSHRRFLPTECLARNRSSPRAGNWPWIPWSQYSLIEVQDDHDHCEYLEEGKLTKSLCNNHGVHRLRNANKAEWLNIIEKCVDYHINRLITKWTKNWNISLCCKSISFNWPFDKSTS